MSVEFHRGRLIDHVQLHVKDLAKSLAFYKAALGALGKGDIVHEGDGYFYADELFIDADASVKVLPVHIAFLAASQEEVQRFHRDALKAGGKDNGKPGPRDYHPGYYAAFVLDPDGNNIEATYHGPSTRSAPSVVFKPITPA
ncbi:hypothetical protein DSM104443_04043 [Usitatibacter rugosus]|uniref:VOC domain-containing protein n=1 Tax=Usitatibacter rugosus TaxID=2732067 RepID=A0A6M4H0C9_9PROT|nr:VOC family protein [Usitatibacter rugosus]QJR12949.1 hypothetical protein DSM104443_04043 [Usitatibacter rugosus]